MKCGAEILTVSAISYIWQMFNIQVCTVIIFKLTACMRMLACFLFRQSEIICDHDCSNYKVVNVEELSALRIISIQLLASRSGKLNPCLDLTL